MKTPLSWIKEYVPDLEVSDKEYMDAMTLSGSKVEGFERLDASLEKIVVGKILKIERHPDADKLIVCQVQVGEKEDEVVQIVTGAPNVKEGDIIPVVLDGGRVAGGHDGEKPAGGIKIKKGKLRGIESHGMMCSIEELGSSREMYPDAPESGIYILSDNKAYEGIQIGSSAIKALGFEDSVFEYEITSNRVDCFGILGIAREAAATFNKKFVPPVVTVKECGEKASDYISVKIENNNLCPRYTARVVKNVKIGPSPAWMQKRLAACGIRPINNLVDITNYVMEEYAQPMHAYDLETIAKNQIVVKTANDGDKFTTLDGVERNLDSSILMIYDGEKAVGIAGIMGGENSKINDDATTVLLEAACFDGTNIRLSSKKLGLRTDASSKFEKGLDPNNALEAMNRACQLIEELGVGEIITGYVEEYPVVKEGNRVPFDAGKINKLLGTDISESDMIEYFARVDLSYDETTKEIVVPSWRQDVYRMADLAEEVARFYGYTNIPSSLPTGEATTGKLPFNLRIENVARNVAEQFGFNEAMCYSFESPKVYDKLLIPVEDELRKNIVIANPLGEDYSIMRTTTLNGMLTSLSTNFNRRNKNVRLYELGNVYIPKSLPLEELPEEKTKLTLGMYGEGDFFDLKGIIEEFIGKVGMTKLTTYDPKSGIPYLHPGRQANIIYEGTFIGYIGEVHPEVLDNYDIGEKVYVAVLDMETIVKYATFDVKYEGIAKYPAVTRDISMVMKKEIMVGEIEEVIRKYSGKLLENYHLFDIYEGAQIKEGHKSVAYSISFRAKDRTLEDKDVTEVMNKILTGLQKLGIELRQ
jgi:phenylalanyl-tRNA synthetase beta chain